MSRFSGRSKQYKRNAARLKREGRPCALCGEWIDPDLSYREGTDPRERRMHPLSFSADHIIPAEDCVARGTPELIDDYSNLQPSHWLCNQRKGNGRNRKVPPIRETPFIVNEF